MRLVESPSRFSVFLFEHDLRANALRLSRGKTGFHPATSAGHAFPDHALSAAPARAGRSRVSRTLFYPHVLTPICAHPARAAIRGRKRGDGDIKHLSRRWKFGSSYVRTSLYRRSRMYRL